MAVCTNSPRWLRVSLRTVTVPRVRPRARRHDVHDLALDAEHVAGPGRRRPGDFPPKADEAASDWQAAVDLEAHGDCRRVPPARREPPEEGLLRGLAIRVKGLRVELARERGDLVARRANGCGS